MFVLKKDYVTVAIDYKASMVRLRWLRQPAEEELKEAFRVSVEAASEYGLTSFLSDNSIGINIDIATQRWASDYSADVVNGLKIERYARVLPQDAMQEIVSYKMFDNMKRIIPTDLEFQVFFDLREAEKWLLQDAPKSVSQRKK